MTQLIDRLEREEAMTEPALTDAETEAVRALKRLARTWPDSLWLFSASGSLCVMKKDGDGERRRLTCNGMDPGAVIETIEIENDGGDW